MDQRAFTPPATDDRTEHFIQRWQGVTASELATAQSFVIDLCELLGVDKPHATAEQSYMFERPLKEAHGDGSLSDRRVDCYKRGHFILEAKKLKAGHHTKGYDDALLRAHAQAQNYARALPAAEGRPPFILVVDVGNVIQLFSEFSRSGGNYIPFPDPRSHQIRLHDLRHAHIRERLQRIWTEPLALDPSRANAEVTREVAAVLAEVAKSLEADGHAPHLVGAFLTRCLFSMFAEDVGLLPGSTTDAEDPGAFSQLLRRHREDPPTLQRMLQALWADMDRGGFSAALAKDVLKFNGKLFKAAHADGYALPLNRQQIDQLLAAARADWKAVEPAIFGTLLERALDPTERHALGAHYTPRAYVERLILPTVMEPLRAEWSNAQAAALLLANEANALDGKKRDDKLAEARAEVRQFHHRLCTVRVLDPACGSGNFLYVTLEHLKRLEGEVLNQLDALGETQEKLGLEGETVSLQQLRGIELNTRAAALAELVLWIGYLQWQARTVGVSHIAEPVVHDYGNIENRDAVLAFDGTEPLTNDAGQPVARWDGSTFKPHPVTGLPVPDEAAQTVQERYLNPRKAAWPAVDFIVGNPPFIGASTMRAALGDGYVDALRSSWPEVPESADFVMYWWHQAAVTVGAGGAQRLGFITTNSIKQTFNRRVVQAALDGASLSAVPSLSSDDGTAGARHSGSLMLPNAQKSAPGMPDPSLKVASVSPVASGAAAVAAAARVPPVSLVFAIADHPWVDSANGAAVRIAMTAAAAGAHEGRLLTVQSETPQDDGEVAVRLSESRGLLHADLRIGADVAAAKPLRSNLGLSSPGVKLHGAGFIVTRSEAAQLGLGTVPGLEQHIREYRNGRDLTAAPRDVMVIDLFGLSAEDVRQRFPAVYQWVLERVKPERDANNRATYRDNWWVFGEARKDFRPALRHLPRFIATVETTKHRVFQFLDASVLPDNMLIAIASDDAAWLGVLSSKVHEQWALSSGGTLEDRPRYNKSICFETFPFPAEDTGLTPALTERIRSLAEQLDAHRKARQAAHPELTLTGMYNVLEKLRSGEALSAKDKTTHEQGLVSVLRTLHDELDAAVLQAYGWSDLGPAPAPTDEAARATWTDTLLQRLVDLNTRRATEEAGTAPNATTASAGQGPHGGTIRWLRPEFQNPATPAQQPTAEQTAMDLGTDADTDPDASEGESQGAGKARAGTASAPGPASGTSFTPSTQQAWPATLPEQIKAVAAILSESTTTMDQDAIAAHFKARGRWRDRLSTILDTLVAIGRVTVAADGQYRT
jgi:hypothetical protein